jgi:hypothetical protein
MKDFPPSLKGNHNAGSMVQNASIGNQHVVPGQGTNRDHPGKSHPPLPLLRVEDDTRRIDANDDRKPAPVNNTLSTLQGDASAAAAAAHLPNDTSNKCKRPARMHLASKPAPKRAKKQGDPRPSYASQNAANNAFYQPAARKTAPPYQDSAQVKVKREPTIKIETDPISAAHEAVLEQLAAAREKNRVLVDKVAAVTTEANKAKEANAGLSITVTTIAVSLNKLTTECDEKETRLKSLSIERDAAVALAAKLQTQLSSATEEQDASRFELKASTTKVDKLTAAIDSLEGNARETSLQMKSLSREKELALANVTELESKLEDACEKHGVALSMVEESNTKINVLVTEQGELQSRNKSLEVQLKDKTQALELTRSDLEAGTSTIAEQENDSNASVTPGATSDEDIPMADNDDDDDDHFIDNLGNDNDGGGDEDDDDDDDAAAAAAAVEPLVGHESSVDSTLRRSSRLQIPTSSTCTPSTSPTATVNRSSSRQSRRRTLIVATKAIEAESDEDFDFDGDDDDGDGDDVAGDGDNDNDFIDGDDNIDVDIDIDIDGDGDGDDDNDNDNDGDLSSPSWENRLSWEDRLSELADYRKEHGHCNVPHKYSENNRLGTWVLNQRKHYKLHVKGKKSPMTHFRIQALESLAFEWDIYGAAWEDRLGELADYCKEHGHCNVPESYSESTKLANWVHNQRSEYSRLHRAGKASSMTLSRIKALESLGFEWSSHGTAWEDRLGELADYCKEHGHCNVPESYSERRKLAKWVANQRRHYRLHLQGKKSPMTLSRVQALESLGFEWDTYGTAWEDRLNELADYRKIHGHCNVPRNYSENAKLGRWVSAQRTQFRLHRERKTSRMTPFRIQALKNLGFEWNRRSAPGGKRS